MRTLKVYKHFLLGKIYVAKLMGRDLFAGRENGPCTFKLK